jgi:hypothetical protein
MTAQSVEGMMAGDFVIERRGGEPRSANRYFCIAPVSTPEHLRLLEALERLWNEK